MFKCKECGSEYDIKPDYCDCGNDTFDEVVVQEPVKSEPAQKSEYVQTSVPESQEPQKVYSNETKKTSSGKYPDSSRLKNTFDPISSIFLLFCIITSIIVLFFVGNPKEEPETPKESTNVETPKINIPSIESFWNNSTAGIINNEKYMAQKANQLQTVPQQAQPQTNPLTALVQPKQEQQPAPQQTVNNVQPQPAKPQSTQTQKPQQTQQKPQTTPIIGKIFGNNNNNTQQTNKSAQKPVQQPQQKTTKQTQPKTNTQTNPAPKIPQTTQTIATQPKQTTTQNNKPVQTITPQKQTTTTAQSQQKPTQQTRTGTQNVRPAQTTAQNVNVTPSTTLRPKATIDTQALKREFDNYKVGLRNTLGRKVDFTKVVGDGECVVAFKIASNGKLTNRSFAKQSSNITLNDAVYSAIMATPSYNPPPSGYNNETLNLKIRFYGGNYDVSLY